MACARASVSGVYAHILREASALSVLLQWALPEPLQAEQATVWLSRFFVYNKQPPSGARRLYDHLMKKFLLLLVGILLALPAVAQSEIRQDGLIYTLYTPDGANPYAAVTGQYLSEKTDVIMPESITKDGVTYPVTDIAPNAFKECSLLTSIVISNSVTSIGQEAFSTCTAFSSVVFGNSVKSIGYRAFTTCFDLTSIVLPESLTSIGGGAFRYCINLSSIKIPNSVASIGSTAFRDCTKLSSIKIPNSVVSIGSKAFSNCKNLTEINYNTKEPIEAEDNLFDAEVYKNATLYIANGGLDKAKSIKPWNLFDKITEKNYSGINDISTDTANNGIDFSAPVEVYNLHGLLVSDNIKGLSRGIYIIRQGDTVKKIAVK